MTNAQRQPSAVPALAPDRDWWRGAVIYQIYPRSYQDSNGDGTGDLKGIIQRLPHIASLGADAIWISPIFTSPMKDFGYDVSDYCGIDPMFGTLADFDEMIVEAHRLGLRVMIDGVISHTSDQHPWFAESRANRSNPKADWYVWTDPKPDGTPPNNWLSVFGGSAWQWDAQRNDQTAPSVNPYNFQDHIYDKSRPENLKFLERFRAVLEEYPAIAVVGEVGDSQRGLEVVAAYTAGNDRVHMCYAFDFLAPEKISAGNVRKVLEDFGRVASDGWACWAFSNHDVMRHASRWGKGEQNRDAYLKVISALLMSMRGSVCLYQGEELGLGEAELSFEDLQDPYGIRFWPEFKGRDGCRTPMVWDASKNGGFSSAKPWLPVPQEHIARAVSKQEGDQTSLLEHYRRFIAFRRNHPALAKGDIEFLAADGDVVAFTRSAGNERIVCVFNLGAAPTGFQLDEGTNEALSGHGFTSTADSGKIKLDGYGTWFGRIA